MPTKRQRKEATCVYSTKEGAHLKIGNAAENAIVANRILKTGLDKYTVK